MHIVQDEILSSPKVRGVPLCAADMFTRIGQASIRQLQRKAHDLRGYSVRQVGLALFYLDGGRVDKRLTSDALEAFQQQGEMTDLQSAGLSLPEYMELRARLASNMEVLNAIRCEQLQHHLSTAPAIRVGGQI